MKRTKIGIKTRTIKEIQDTRPAFLLDLGMRSLTCSEKQRNRNQIMGYL